MKGNFERLSLDPLDSTEAEEPGSRYFVPLLGSNAAMEEDEEAGLAEEVVEAD